MAGRIARPAEVEKRRGELLVLEWPTFTAKSCPDPIQGIDPMAGAALFGSTETDRAN
jgi:hypothetical protein